MPLTQSASKPAIAGNIVEMMNAGHPRDQAIAAALNTARKVKARKAHGGATSSVRLHTGPIHSSVAGRTDHLPMHVPHGAYVLPADIVSGMGQGNTMAGFKVAKQLPSMFSASFYGQQKAGAGAIYGNTGLPYHGPSPQKAAGGGLERSEHDDEAARDRQGVPIVAAGGEHVYHPREVRQIGGGDLDRGHRILDKFVIEYRDQLRRALGKLPGPKRN